MTANETQFKTSGTVNYALVPLHCYESDRAVLKPAKMNKSGENEWCTSEGVYLDDDGKEHTLFFMLPTQRCYGLNVNYDQSQKKAEAAGDVTKADGFQTAYPLTSLKTMKKPTKDEKYIKTVFESLNLKTVDRMKEEAGNDKTEMPDICLNSYEGAKRKKDMTKAVKPLFAYPNIKDTKTPNKEKPERTYIKLLSRGKGSKGQKVTVQSKFYGPGDSQMSHLSLIGEKGNGDWEICCKWDGAYWGAHGPKAPQAGSTRLRVYDATVNPGSAGLPSDRMAPRNTTPAVEQDFGDKADYDDPSGEVPSDDFERETTKKKKTKEVGKKSKKVALKAKTKKSLTASQKRKLKRQQKAQESESESGSGSGSGSGSDSE
uniref:Uncharacterized protein n=1 Tax=Marseillevirus LCMAC101 TaxID=2506602 RepID=A0A481YSU7_9VIRU|nr:MAG: protein of unknown function DUF2738 [Marseillevirus LCMAC101]